MKIALFEPYPLPGGGSERVALDVSRFLAARGHDLFLIHGSDGSLLAEYDKFVKAREKLELRPFGWRTLAGTLKRTSRAGAQCRAWGAQMIFSSDVQYLRFLALTGCLARLPVVMHLGIANALPCFSQRQCLRFFAAGIAPSEHTAAAWRTDGWPERRLHVIPNGVDTGRFRPAKDRNTLRQSLGLPVNRRIILYVGRLVPEKGIGTLLAAFKELRRSMKDTLLVLVGAGARGETIDWQEKSATDGLPAEAVQFAGRKMNPEDYLASADVVVVPSEWDEPFGLVPVEAMACGCVPVVSDRGILPRLVGGTARGLVFPAGHAEMLAERLGYWLEHEPQRLELAKAMRQEAVDRHDVQRMAEGYEGVFAQVSRS